MGDPGWLVRPRPKADARLRLFCFPYSGGTAAIFRGWPQWLGNDVEVIALEMPGHGRRRREPLCRKMDEVQASLLPELRPHLDRPYALFGHSLGAFVVFGILNHLRALDARDPVHVFVSGLGGPAHWQSMERFSEVSQDRFPDVLRVAGGTPDKLMAYPELLAEIERVLRSDLAVCESCPADFQEAFDIAVTAFGGTGDAMIPVAHLEDWARITRSRFRVVTFPGGHFFVNAHAEAVVKEIRSDLAGKP